MNDADAWILQGHGPDRFRCAVAGVVINDQNLQGALFTQRQQ